MTFNKLYRFQDELLERIIGAEEQLFPEAKVILAGGTALARCYLHHRISYDLDFFLSRRFDPQLLQRRLKDAGITLQEVEIVNDPLYAVQLHGQVEEGGEIIRVSFLEDVYSDMFPVVEVEGIRTETIEGLYHRKLRTITGSREAASPAGVPVRQGSRQTARDLFDLYVLDTEVKPILDFLTGINEDGANVPDLALESGIKKMPWRDLMDEFETLEIAEKYKGIKAFDVKRHFDECFDIAHRVRKQ